jgi:hypothetical protein
MPASPSLATEHRWKLTRGDSGWRNLPVAVSLPGGVRVTLQQLQGWLPRVAEKSLNCEAKRLYPKQLTATH